MKLMTKPNPEQLSSIRVSDLSAAHEASAVCEYASPARRQTAAGSRWAGDMP